MDYKYAYPEKSEIIISKTKKTIRPAFDVEIIITSLTKDELIGYVVEYVCPPISKSGYTMDDVREDYLKEYKSWFGLGKMKKKYNSSWVALKDKSNVVRFDLRNYRVVYSEVEN